MARGQTRHALEERPRSRNVPEGEIGGDSSRVELPRDLRVRENGLELAGEDQATAAGPVVQRLLPDPVAPEDQPAPAFVPDRDGEHAVEFARELDRRERLGEVGYHLGVATRPHDVSVPFERSPKLAEVVDLPVEHDGNAAVLVRDRRVAGLEVDDRQAVLADYGASPR